MYKILVPTDFSEIADNGLDAAIKLSSKIEFAEVHLVNFVPPPTDVTFSATGDIFKKTSDEETVYTVELGRVNLEKLLLTVEKFNIFDVNVVTEVIFDDFEKGIETYVAKQDIDLIIMGTSGEESYTEYFVGNHADQTIRLGACPVLTLKKPVSQFDIQNIVLATDLNNEATDAVRNIVRFAQQFDATLHILHVDTSDSNLKELIEEKLEEYTHRNHIYDNYTINVVQHKNEESGIIEFANQKEADIIALMTHERNAVANFFVSSISEEIVKEAEKPVLTVTIE